MGIDDLILDPDAQQVIYQDQGIHLTKIEFKLLEQLLLSNGGVLERQELMFGVWGPRISVELRTVDSHIVRLRRKLNRLGQGGPTIETVWGLGYRVKDSPLYRGGSLSSQKDKSFPAKQNREGYHVSLEGVTEK